MVAISSDVERLARPRGYEGPAMLVAAAAAAVLLFWSGIVSLVDAWSIPEYSHGPIIPLISLFLFLREMRGVPPVAEGLVTDRWPGVFVMTGAIAVGALGLIVNIDDIVTYGLILWIAGLVLLSFGWRRGVLFWPAVLHLVFMLPLPQFVYWQVSITLQIVSSEIGVGLIQLFGIPVYLDGNIIDLGVYKLQVAEACSGLRYLFPMLSFSYVFAVLYNGPKWHKLVLLLSAAPITVAMNSFRIGMIGVLVNSYGIEHAEGFLHSFEGWIIFVACVFILFCEAWVLQRFTKAPKPVSQTIDVEFEGLDRELARFFAVAPSAALGAAIVVTGTAALAWSAAPEREPVQVDRSPLVVFPMAMDGWVGRAQTLDTQIEQVLGADDYLSATYASDDAALPVDLFAAYYRSQTEGSGIHSPEVCIPAGGWEVSDWSKVTVDVAGEAPFEVNRAVIQKGVSRQLVYFWFEQRGRRMTSDYAAKAVTVLDSALTGRTDGGLVRLITPLDPGEPDEAGDARLERFAASLTARLGRFFPE